MRGSRFNKDEIVLKKEVRELEVVKNKPMKNLSIGLFYLFIFLHNYAG